MVNERVLLGMSGGVDSSMSAWYLLQQGYEVVGITFNTVSPLSSPESKQFISEAKKLAQSLFKQKQANEPDLPGWRTNFTS